MTAELQKIRINTLDALKEYILNVGSSVLFRGQTKHFENSGFPSIVTSFDRQRCVPPEMLKWSRYADEILTAFVPGKSDFAFNQAVLQHYGFRSFYLDCSDTAAVSAWFAGHQYSEKWTFELSEDCNEEPLFLRKKTARYDQADGTGHLYVLDREVCEQVGLIDLTAIEVAGARTRPSVQRAYLLGPIHNRPLPPECFIAHIEADCDVLRAMASEASLVRTDDVFPPRSEDPILNALMDLPWNAIQGVMKESDPIPAFRRAVELPEYESSFFKIASSSTAFYRGGTVVELFDQVDGFSGGIGVKVPQDTIFGSPDLRFPRIFPQVQSLVEEYRGVIFEAPALVKFPQFLIEPEYQKGLALEIIEPDLVHLGPLWVRHPGQRITAAGVGPGWFYRIKKDGTWRREIREGECTCQSDRPHLRHLSELYMIERFLAEDRKA